MYVDYEHQQFDDDQESFLKELAKAIPFEDADIEENKKGRLSTPQMVRLVFDAIGPFLGLVGTAAGLVSLVVMLYVAGPYVLTKVRVVMTLSKFLLFGLSALFFGMVAFIINFLLASGRVFLLVQDLMEGKVESVTGRLTPSKAETAEEVVERKTERFSFVVKGEYFAVSEEAHELMMLQGSGNFQIYVTPRRRYLVGIEPAGVEAGKDPFKLEYKQA
jgi:hypothetical protein